MVSWTGREGSLLEEEPVRLLTVIRILEVLEKWHLTVSDSPEEFAAPLECLDIWPAPVADSWVGEKEASQSPKLPKDLTFSASASARLDTVAVLDPSPASIAVVDARPLAESPIASSSRDAWFGQIYPRTLLYCLRGL